MPMEQSNLGLQLPTAFLESDMSSSTSSLRESSDCDMFGMEEEDDKLTLTGGSDPNDTDSSAVDQDSLTMDRRSRRKRSMQRLAAKNKTLKASLAQAKADLAMERHNRAMIDQIYLKIKKELNDKLEAEEIKVADLKGDLEQMTAEMNELKEQLAKEKENKRDQEDRNRSKNASMGSYKIGYDHSNYSLTSGLGGGLMLHHSNFLSRQDEEDEFYYPLVSAAHGSNVSSTITAASVTPSRNDDDNEGSVGNPLDRDDDSLKTSAERDTNERQEDKEKAEDVEKKVTFLEEPQNIPVYSPSQHASAQVDRTHKSEDHSDNEDNEPIDDDRMDDEQEAPCTMMELMIKRQQEHSKASSCGEDEEVQDSPADANETFDSMAHKFLYQALHAKFTPARTILQLDDLLLKYDAPPEELILVLTQESMRWWENERLEAGGPVTGGWGVKAVKEAVEAKFKAIYVPLLLNYVASHQEQRMLLDKLAQTANSSHTWKRNHPAQLVALYQFDVLDADAILEWWHLLKEPQGVLGHGDDLRSMVRRN